MSTIKPSDYLALTLQSYPKLTDIEASLLCVLLLEADRCGAFQRVLATTDPSLSASLEMLIWAQAWSQQDGQATVQDTRVAYIEVLKAHETGSLSTNPIVEGRLEYHDRSRVRLRNWVRKQIPSYPME
jgi:hypothetical protein